MHELGITQDILEIVPEHSKGAQVQRVVLQIGTLSAAFLYNSRDGNWCL